MSKTGYEQHIKGNDVFWCSMTPEQRAEYSADHVTPASKDWTPGTRVQFSGEPKYRMGRQGGYGIDQYGFANNGLIFR